MVSLLLPKARAKASLLPVVQFAGLGGRRIALGRLLSNNRR